MLKILKIFWLNKTGLILTEEPTTQQILSPEFGQVYQRTIQYFVHQHFPFVELTPFHLSLPNLKKKKKKEEEEKKINRRYEI